MSSIWKQLDSRRLGFAKTYPARPVAPPMSLSVFSFIFPTEAFLKIPLDLQTWFLVNLFRISAGSVPDHFVFYSRPMCMSFQVYSSFNIGRFFLRPIRSTAVCVSHASADTDTYKTTIFFFSKIFKTILKGFNFDGQPCFVVVMENEIHVQYFWRHRILYSFNQ